MPEVRVRDMGARGRTIAFEVFDGAPSRFWKRV
jgi:hypothetical protein